MHAEKLGILIVDDTNDRRNMSNESVNKSFAYIPVSGHCHASPFKEIVKRKSDLISAWREKHWKAEH